MDTHRHTGGELEALDVLPDLSLPPVSSNFLRATGTDNTTSAPGNEAYHSAHHIAHQTRRETPRHGAINQDDNSAEEDTFHLIGMTRNPRKNTGKSDVLLIGAATCQAEAEGFEPPDDLRRLRFSRPVQ